MRGRRGARSSAKESGWSWKSLSRSNTRGDGRMSYHGAKYPRMMKCWPSAEEPLLEVRNEQGSK